MPVSKHTVSLKRASFIAKKLIEQMRKKRLVSKVRVAGTIRRKEPQVGDIDIVVIVKPGKEDAFYDWMIQVLDPLTGGPQRYTGTYYKLPVQILLTEEREWGAAMLYLTGPKGYNISRRRVAKDKGYLLSQHGLFGRKSGRYLAGRTEREIFAKLGITDRKPEDR